ncbi:hypothetical protein V6N11_061436 [Hibiscus sabdariffa]|uniref:Uncharacterized protein n=1 Tax=Hibiscus sabdariffa TaxID=183260 RepID=A0ABR2NW67_9ROSI
MNEQCSENTAVQEMLKDICETGCSCSHWMRVPCKSDARNIDTLISPEPEPEPVQYCGNKEHTHTYMVTACRTLWKVDRVSGLISSSIFKVYLEEGRGLPRTSKLKWNGGIRLQWWSGSDGSYLNKWDIRAPPPFTDGELKRTKSEEETRRANLKEVKRDS